MIECGTYYDAKFIGTYKHCGFKKGELYSIEIEDNIPYGKVLTVLGKNGFSNVCPYSNIDSIEKSWQINV